MSPTKTCKQCGVTKPTSEYHSHKTTKDRLQPHCKQCMSEYGKRYRAKNRSHIKKVLHDWYVSNRDEVKRKTQAYNIANADKIALNKRRYYQAKHDKFTEKNRAWRKANKERIVEYQHGWYLENRDAVLERAQQYRENNREIKAQADREWKRRNPDKVRASLIKRKAMKRNAKGSFTADDIQSMLKGQHDLCVYCRTNIGDCYTVDHVTPLSRGGSNWPDNLQLLCSFCNTSKNNKTHDEYLEYLAKTTLRSSP